MTFSNQRRQFLQTSALASLATLSASGIAAESERKAGKKIAVVFGGGSARGFAHIGVIKALETLNIKPSLVVGTSAGSVVGALYAAGYTGAQLESLAMKIRDNEVIDLVSGSNRRGMVVGDNLQNLINSILNQRTIEQLKIPFVAVATNLNTGSPALFKSGDTGFAVRASCSIPGVFIPAKQNDVEYADGGLVSPVPIKIARELGADKVIAVDVSSSPNPSNQHGMYELLMYSFEIMGASLIRAEAGFADVFIKPDVGRISGTDFSVRSQMIGLGYHGGMKMVKQIREKVLA